MRSVIIPVDFSETSLNAARYAAEMLSGKADTRVFLYNLFEDPDEAGTVKEYLESLRKELVDKGLAHVECIQEVGDDLIDSLSRLAYQKTATLIIMGITGKSALQQALVGSNTLDMVDRNVCPVMIIPPEAVYQGIRNVAFTSDLKHEEDSNTILFIKQILEIFNPALHIVNVDSEHYVSITEEYQEGRASMEKIFNEYQPEFYFLNLYNFEEAITQFTADRQIDCIVTVPRYHSFWENLFKGSHTRKLVYHSTVPVVAVHD